MGDVVSILLRSGGSARFADLLGLTSARSIRTALAAGLIRRVARGVYALPEHPSDLTVARANGGVLSRESAALHHGLEVVTRPPLPHITVARNQRRRRTNLECVLHRTTKPLSDPPVLRAVPPAWSGKATSPLRTVLDCARHLPFGEALSIADAAVRMGKVDRGILQAEADVVRGPGRLKAIRVAQEVDGRSESALESMLRARVIEAGITGFVPQYWIGGDGFAARVDLANPHHKIVLEADSFAFHGTRAALRKDCRRHVNLAMRGWLLLRYSWEDVMLDEDWVGRSLDATIRANPQPRRQAA